jgi:hypothetical protein
LAASDEIELQPTESTADETTIIIQSIGAHHVSGAALTEAPVAFDPSSAFDSAGSGNAMGFGATVHETFIAAIAALNGMEQPIKHGATARDDIGAPLHGDKAIDTGADPVLAPEKENHGASRNADNHGHVADADPNAEVAPGLLKTSDAGASSHSMSAGENKQGSPSGQDAGAHSGTGPTAHAGPETAPHGLDDSFRFRSSISEGPDVAGHGKSDHMPASMDHDAAVAMGRDGQQTIELSGSDLTAPHNDHSENPGVVHLPHDLMV